VFGSVARGQERPDSDIDLLIDFAEALDTELHRKVDLVLSRSVSPYFCPFIEADARPL
jgi:predicted nucleotidyltransferase